MPIYICETCGTSFSEDIRPPAQCPVCEDERQFVPRKGQTWISLEQLLADHSNTWRTLEPGLLQIHTYPQIGIGQRAFLIQTPEGNVLWDCLALIDEATKTIIDGLGGLRAIAISHPHYYTRMQDWAAAFDAPVHIHADDRQWVMRPSPFLRFWEGESLKIGGDLTVLRLGGHFPGASVLHWPQGSHGNGALLSGDTVEVVNDTGWMTFMWSYPNMIPLSGPTVQRIAKTLEPWPFDRVYSAFPGLETLRDGKAALMRSATRHVRLLNSHK